MIADQNFYAYVLGGFFYPMASATAKGQSLSGPKIRLQPKVKIAPTVQDCIFYFLESINLQWRHLKILLSS